FFPPPAKPVVVGAHAGRAPRWLPRWRPTGHPLGPPPPGDLPNTIVPLVVAVMAWLLLTMTSSALLPPAERAKYGNAMEVALSKGVECLVALAMFRAATSGTRR